MQFLYSSLIFFAKSKLKALYYSKENFPSITYLTVYNQVLIYGWVNQDTTPLSPIPKAERFWCPKVYASLNLMISCLGVWSADHLVIMTWAMKHIVIHLIATLLLPNFVPNREVSIGE